MTKFQQQILLGRCKRLIAAGFISGAFEERKWNRSQRLVQPGVAA